LESLATRLAAGRGSSEHWQRMEVALAGLPESGDPGDNEAIIEIDEACHQIIYQAADNEFLRDSLTTLYALSLRLWYFSLSKIGDMRSSILEHERILQALKSGNEDRAACLMEQHIGTFQEEIQSVMFRSN
jgi:DNA-binding GntR family transcriptional regulator